MKKRKKNCWYIFICARGHNQTIINGTLHIKYDKKRGKKKE